MLWRTVESVPRPVQLLSHARFFATPSTTTRQASLSITNFRSSPKPMSIESVMPSNHLILCRPLLLLPSIIPSIRVFSNELALHIRWPEYWSFTISPSNKYSGLISFRTDWSDLIAVQRAPKSLLQHQNLKGGDLCTCKSCQQPHPWTIAIIVLIVLIVKIVLIVLPSWDTILKGMSPLFPPLPGKAIRLFFST